MEEIYTVVTSGKPYASYVIVGDVQFNQWQEEQRPSRWKDMPVILAKAMSISANDPVSRGVIVLGDLFESKRSVRADVLAEVYSVLARAIKEYDFGPHGRMLHIIAGNHDFYNGRYNHTALYLSPAISVYTKHGWIDRELRIASLPYGQEIKENMNYRVLCAHVELRGAVNANGQIEEHSGVSDKLLRRRGARQMVINGHYHVPQKLNLGPAYVEVYVTGSPFELNWSDSYVKKKHRSLGFLSFDEKQNAFYRQGEDTGYPKFYDRPNHPDARAGVDFVPTEVRTLCEEDREGKADFVNMVNSMSPQEFIKAFVCDRVHEERDRDLLIQAGLDLMKGDVPI